MGRRRGQGPQQSMKGFRPGKEPPELRKAHAKKQFGDLNAGQERMVELFAERSPEESRKLISRWKMGALVAGVLLSVLTVLAWMWTWIAGGSSACWRRGLLRLLPPAGADGSAPADGGHGRAGHETKAVGKGGPSWRRPESVARWAHERFLGAARDRGAVRPA
jgi:hypothetical protein